MSETYAASLYHDKDIRSDQIIICCAAGAGPPCSLRRNTAGY